MIGFSLIYKLLLDQVQVLIIGLLLELNLR